jgi:hypothetical protein
MVDEAFGTVLIGGRLARRAAGVALTPARVAWTSPLGSPGRAFLAHARASGRRGRSDLAELVRATTGELAALVDDVVPALVERTASSHRTTLALDALFAGPLPSAVVDRLVAAGTIERLARETLTTDLPEQLLREILAGPLPGVAADEAVSLLERGAADPATAAAVDRLLASPAVEALLGTILDSPVTLGLTDRVLQSAEMRRILETVAASPEIRTAVAEQSAGIATDVAAGVRSRSVRLDDAAEQAVRGLFRRGR